MDLQKATEIAEAACDAAGAVLRARFRRELASDMKPDNTIVTEADAEAERAMRAVLTAAFPGHRVTGEELPPEGPAESRYEWVLDPIDGTVAFACGKAQFTTLCALLEDGVPVLGVIDQPVSRERWIGARGQATVFDPSPFTGEGDHSVQNRGASAPLPPFGRPSPRFAGGDHLSFNDGAVPPPFTGEGDHPKGGGGGGRRTVCTPSSVTRLSEARLGTTDPALFTEGEAEFFERLRARARITSLGGDAYQYGLLASGHLDLIFESGLSRHDIAALVPVLLGAGCAAADAQGVSYDGRALGEGKFSLVAAATGEVLGEALSVR